MSRKRNQRAKRDCLLPWLVLVEPAQFAGVRFDPQHEFARYWHRGSWEGDALQFPPLRPVMVLNAAAAQARAAIGVQRGERGRTGDEMVVFGALLDTNNHSTTRYARGIAHDPEADRWHKLPSECWAE